MLSKERHQTGTGPISKADQRQLDMLLMDDNPLRRNAGAPNLDLGFEQPHLRIVPRHEKLGHEDQKEGKRRIHLAGYHCGA